MGALATFERTMDRWTGGWVNHEPTRSTGAVDRNKLVNLREVQTYWEGRQNGTPFGRDEENNLDELGRHQTMAALNHAIENGRVAVYFSTGLPNQTYNARMLKFAYVQAGDVIDAADAAGLGSDRRTERGRYRLETGLIESRDATGLISAGQVKLAT